jgi:hypothetical protein
MDAPKFDLAAAHRFLAANCFNRAWELIEKSDRSDEDDLEMLLCALASLWHWRQRPDCTDRNLSISFWQVSRVYSLLGEGGNARRFAELCLAKSRDETPFYLGYALEALARAAMICGDREQMQKHLTEARRAAVLVEDPQDRATLERDLGSLG